MRDLSESGESLQDSLDDIEKASTFLEETSSSRRIGRISIQNSMRCSRRISGISLDLSDVEEDEESRPGNEPPAEGGDPGSKKSTQKGRRNPPAQHSRSLGHSFLDDLPDEIKEFLDTYKTGKDEMSPTPRRRKSTTASRNSRGSIKRFCQSRCDDSSSDSFMSSFNSANFNGDFSAWDYFFLMTRKCFS